MSTHEKLLPCPFCESDMDSFPGRYEGAFAKGSDGTYSVNCDCGAMGPAVMTMEAAIAAWNRRTPPAAVPDGWVMVPRAVSSKMLEAAQEAVILGETEDGSPARLSYREAEECYRAMISAAPAAPTEASDDQLP